MKTFMQNITDKTHMVRESGCWMEVNSITVDFQVQVLNKNDRNTSKSTAQQT